MSQQDPFAICLAEFTPQTPQQKEFCEKAEIAVRLYAAKLSAFNMRALNTVSAVKIADVASHACRHLGFIEWYTGELVAEHGEQYLFYANYGNSTLFTILDRCPSPRPEDDPHYHLRYEGNDADKGASDIWKRFPVGVVLEGLKALLQRLGDDHLFVDANALLASELATLRR